MNCPICDDNLTLENCVSTECNHTFCKECFWKWTKSHNTCPLCRHSILVNSEELEEQKHIRKMIEQRSELSRQIRYFENKLKELKQTTKSLQNYMSMIKNIDINDINIKEILNQTPRIQTSRYVSTLELNNQRLERISNFINNR